MEVRRSRDRSRSSLRPWLLLDQWSQTVRVINIRNANALSLPPPPRSIRDKIPRQREKKSSSQRGEEDRTSNALYDPLKAPEDQGISRKARKNPEDRWPWKTALNESERQLISWCNDKGKLWRNRTRGREREWEVTFNRTIYLKCNNYEAIRIKVMDV